MLLALKENLLATFEFALFPQHNMVKVSEFVNMFEMDIKVHMLFFLIFEVQIVELIELVHFFERTYFYI